MAVLGDSQPNFTTLADVVGGLGNLTAKRFAQVLTACDRQELTGRERFAIDGSIEISLFPAIMKLMPQTLKRAFARVGDQSDTPDPLVIAKFFEPTGTSTWWATEYDPEERLFFGYITGLGCDE